MKMVQQEKSTCPACGKVTKIGQKFCISCGIKLSEVSETVTTTVAPPQLQTTENFPMKGWEVSPDRIKMYEKIMSLDPVGDPIITSKCKIDRENGFLIVSDNGFAWRIKMGMTTSMYSSGKSKWVRWHDVANIIPKKNGQILVELKIRKNGALIVDGKGKYKIKRWKLTIKPNKGESSYPWKQRLDTFNNIISEIFNRNKVDTDPPTSDSRM